MQKFWTVDPDAKTIMVLVRGKSGFKVSGIYGEGPRLCSPMLAGFSIDLDATF